MYLVRTGKYALNTCRVYEAMCILSLLNDQFTYDWPVQRAWLAVNLITGL